MYSLLMVLGSLSFASAELARCRPYQLEKTSQYDKLEYNRRPDGENTYLHGTYVTLKCTSGPVVGGKNEAVCSNGDWVGQIGRCPNMCDFEELWTERHFYHTMLHPRPSQPTKWAKHLGQAVGKCYLEHIPNVDHWTFTCRDGIWYPLLTCIRPW